MEEGLFSEGPPLPSEKILDLGLEKIPRTCHTADVGPSRGAHVNSVVLYHKVHCALQSEKLPSRTLLRCF